MKAADLQPPEVMISARGVPDRKRSVAKPRRSQCQVNFPKSKNEQMSRTTARTPEEDVPKSIPPKTGDVGGRLRATESSTWALRQQTPHRRGV